MKKPSILLVDDDRNLLRVLEYQVKESGYRVISESSPFAAVKRFNEESIDLVVTDLRMPEMDGISLIKRLKVGRPDLPVIVLTAHGTIDRAVEAIKAGASDFLTKPFEKEELWLAIEKALKMINLVEENRRLTLAIQKDFQFEGIIGSSKPFKEVLSLAQQLAAVETTVLIQGASGTGKELLARAIHFNSPRKTRPFVVVNCGAIPRDLLESELFGYRKGAFTGAVSDRQGRFSVADSGSLFLDEIGELPPEMQVKLLRVLQEKQLDVIGDPHPRPVDVRIIAATNKDLWSMMRKGTFREDLYYRLSVAPLTVPTLRQRAEDIPLLVHHLLDRFNRRFHKQVRCHPDVLEALKRHPWPGNVRELENIMERLVVFNQSGMILCEDLPPEIRQPSKTLDDIALELPEEGFSLEQVERDILLASLEKNDWNQSQTARYMGLTRNTLIYRMKKFDLKRGVR
jgi:two-component system NtrC family response regulator